MKPQPISKAERVKRHIHEVIFEADTPAGKYFDLALIVCIIGSVIVVMLDSVSSIHVEYLDMLKTLEWTFTILFSIEYILRLYSIGRPMRYALSFYGIIDLLAVLPTYLSLIFTGSQFLAVIRIL